MVWNGAHHDWRNRESLFRMALYAPRWPIEPPSVRAPLGLQARSDRGHAAGAARHRNGDLHGYGRAAAARPGACVLARNARPHPWETMMEALDKRDLDNTAPFSSAGLIIRQKEPRNLESPFDQIDSYLTPTELFYIRSHFPIPSLDRATYQLRIDGAVRHPFALSYEELRSMRSETRVATLECAGNWRVVVVPEVQGARGEGGAVSNAEWAGVPLRALLARAGLEKDAWEIVLEGAAREIPKEEPVPPEP